MSLVPTMANALLNAPDLGAYDLSSMQEINIGGAAASPEADRAHGAGLRLQGARRIRLD